VLSSAAAAAPVAIVLAFVCLVGRVGKDCGAIKDGTAKKKQAETKQLLLLLLTVVVLAVVVVFVILLQFACEFAHWFVALLQIQKWKTQSLNRGYR
jgi:hypothetical protein